MEWNQIEEQWARLSSRLRESYATISDDELKFMDRNRDALLAKVRQRTGLDARTAENQLDNIVAGLAAIEPAAAARPPPPAPSK